jgi:hypothetical protein
MAVYPDGSSPWLSARELMQRWKCSRSSVARIAERHGIRRLVFGEDENCMVRYCWADVVRFEDEWLEEFCESDDT